jgi:hypothetical protein
MGKGKVKKGQVSEECVNVKKVKKAKRATRVKRVKRVKNIKMKMKTR